MFALFKKREDYRKAAGAVYGVVLGEARKPLYYDQYGVPDSFDGRFDLLVLLVYMVMERMLQAGAPGRAFNQALFDALFCDMDQTLREMGVGDMSFPKHMRRMMTGFNGRMHVYTEAFQADPRSLIDALRRNLYAGSQSPQDGVITRLTERLDVMRKRLNFTSAEDLLKGRFVGWNS